MPSAEVIHVIWQDVRFDFITGNLEGTLVRVKIQKVREGTETEDIQSNYAFLTSKKKCNAPAQAEINASQ